MSKKSKECKECKEPSLIQERRKEMIEKVNQVMDFVRAGFTVKEICAQLHMSESSVRSYIKAENAMKSKEPSGKYLLASGRIIDHKPSLRDFFCEIFPDIPIKGYWKKDENSSRLRTERGDLVFTYFDKDNWKLESLDMWCKSKDGI